MARLATRSRPPPTGSVTSIWRSHPEDRRARGGRVPQPVDLRRLRPASAHRSRSGTGTTCSWTRAAALAGVQGRRLAPGCAPVAFPSRLPEICRALIAPHRPASALTGHPRGDPRPQSRPPHPRHGERPIQRLRVPPRESPRRRPGGIRLSRAFLPPSPPDVGQLRRIVEEALEAEVEDRLGRGYYGRGDEESRGLHNGYRRARLKSAEGAIEYGVPQVRGLDEPYRSEIRKRLERRTDNEVRGEQCLADAEPTEC